MVKHTQTIRRQFATNCLSVFDYFVILALVGLNHIRPMLHYMSVTFAWYGLKEQMSKIPLFQSQQSKLRQLALFWFLYF